jgi:hypothetical protein
VRIGSTWSRVPRCLLTRALSARISDVVFFST